MASAAAPSAPSASRARRGCAAAFAPIEAGYYLSDEPATATRFGIRIESDLVATEAETKYGWGSRLPASST